MPRERGQARGGPAKEYWGRFTETCRRVGWTFTRDESMESLEMAGWLQDSFGNEIHVIKRKDVPDIRLIVYLFFKQEFDRELLARIADICWLDGVTWRLDPDLQQGQSALLLGHLLPKNDSPSGRRDLEKSLWYASNVLVFCEYAVRKLMPLREPEDLVAMIGRLSSHRPGVGAAMAPPPKGEVAPGQVERLAESDRFSIYSLVDYEGEDCLAICSRLSEHREFTWLVPARTEVYSHFLDFAGTVSARESEPVSMPLRTPGMENQIVRILGDYASEWEFSELRFDLAPYETEEPPEKTFHVYRIRGGDVSRWVIHNRSMCESLWLMDDETWAEFRSLLGRWHEKQVIR